MKTFESCLQKQARIKAQFALCKTADQKYAKIIELGKTLPPFSEDQKIPAHLVKGCQSQMYLHARMQEGKIFFSLYSDALISKGLGALLLKVYNEESTETILSCPPAFLQELEIHKSLSPGRSNGVASLFLKMKQEALRLYSQAS